MRRSVEGRERDVRGEGGRGGGGRARGEAGVVLGKERRRERVNDVDR